MRALAGRVREVFGGEGVSSFVERRRFGFGLLEGKLRTDLSFWFGGSGW